MNHAALVETLRPLPRVGRVRISAQIDRLQRICGDSQPLEVFLEEVVDVLRRVFGAAAGGFWFRSGQTEEVHPAVRLGFDELAFSSIEIASLEEAVSSLWQSDEPVAERFDHLPAALLVGPVRSPQEAVGAFQLVITDLAAESRDEWNRRSAGYLLALRSVLVAIQPEMLRRMRVRSVPLLDANEGLERLGHQIHGIQRSIRLAIERFLHEHSGVTFGSFDDNLQFVRSVQKLLDAHGLRVRCPECGHPAILRCSRNASARAGVFVFDHYLPAGRTFHGGGAALPTLRIVGKPARRRKAVLEP